MLALRGLPLGEASWLICSALALREGCEAASRGKSLRGYMRAL